MRIKFLPLIVLSLTIGLTFNSFAEEQSSVAQVDEQSAATMDYSDQSEATQQQVVQEQVLDQQEAAPQETASKIVTAIEIKGNKNISTNTIFSKVKTRIGSPYQENVVSDDLKRLYLLGFFSDIKIDTQDYKDGIKVIFTVAERPIIGKITFAGITRITMKEEKLKDQLKSRETQYLDYPNLAEDVKILKKMYEKMGFGQAAVDPKVDIDKEANRCTIEFKVVEGVRFSIKDILVEGNNSFPSKRVLNLLKTKRAWLFNAGVLKDEVLKEDIERVKSFYQKNGFADVAVEYEVTTDPKKPYIYIHIKVTEGKKYLVGNIAITGTKDVPEKVVISKLSVCTPGKVFSQEALKQDAASIQGVYFDRGYISCQVQDTTALNPETGRVDISYNIVENQVSYVNKIKVRGNIKTKDIVIRRDLKIKPGERFDGDKLRRSKEKLQNLGYFEDVSYDTTDTAEPDKKDLIVDV
ncbi:MAG: outer membrane protein assembly factor BamA, partial [Candidatus Omnitrophota bacterium]